MRQRIGILGSRDESAQWAARLASNPELEVVSELEPALAADTVDVLVDLHGNAVDRPELLEKVQVVSRATAELLWLPTELPEPAEPPPCVEAPPLPHEPSLHEVLAAHRLMTDSDELYGRVLELGIRTADAEGGSLMLFFAADRTLRIVAARGVERELWGKIQVPLGSGVAGRAAALGEPVFVSGRADPDDFTLLRARHDVGHALCIPLIRDGEVEGVLNLHRSPGTPDFTEQQRSAAVEMAQSHAEVIAQSRSHTNMSERAARFSAHREIRDVLKHQGSLIERLNALCDSLAQRADGGIAVLYLCEPNLDELRLIATSLAGSGFGDYRVRFGEGIEGGVARDQTAVFLPRPDGSIAYAALPLRSGDTLVGVLALQLGEKPFDDGSAVRETLLELASLLADEVASAQAALLRDSFATRIAAVGESGLQFLAQSDAAEIAQLATSAVGMILDADHAILRLRDEAAHRFAIVSYFGSADGPLQERLFEFDQRTAGEALKRRAPIRLAQIAEDPGLATSAPVQTLLAVPLYRGNTPIGTLCAYDRVPTDEFTPAAFLAEDMEVLIKLARFVERALANVQSEPATSPDSAAPALDRAAFEQRFDSELLRSSERRTPLAVAVWSIENLDAASADDDPDGRARLVGHAARSLRTNLRAFDVLARIGADRFAVLLPEAGDAPEERVTALARRVAESVKTNAETKRTGLAIGYAIYPNDGEDRDSLMQRAEVARIRTV